MKKAQNAPCLNHSLSNALQKTYRSLMRSTRLLFTGPTEAEIVEAAIEDTLVIYMQHLEIPVTGTIEVVLPPPNWTHCHQCYNPHCPCHGWCQEGCGCHAEGTNGVYCVGDPDWTLQDL